MAQIMLPWDTPIPASWTRSMRLSSLEYKPGTVTMVVENDDDGKTWRLQFHSIQGIRVTTYECASTILREAGGRGALFEVAASQWIDVLGRGSIRFLDQSRHFVIFCYDEVIEVVAHRC